MNFGASVSAAVLGTLGLPVEVGIIGTPVIDPKTSTLYVVHFNADNGIFRHYLHALDLLTGAEKLDGPMALAGVVSGTNNYDDDGAGRVYFHSASHLQRCALTLAMEESTSPSRLMRTTTRFMAGFSPATQRP